MELKALETIRTRVSCDRTYFYQRFELPKKRDMSSLISFLIGYFKSIPLKRNV